MRYDGTTIKRGPVPFTMDPDREARSIRKIGDLAFDLMLPGHGVPLRPEASGKVREFAKNLVPVGS